MPELQLGLIEARFADLIWANAPVTTSALVKLAEAELHWKRTTTHTVIRRLCEKGLFENQVYPGIREMLGNLKQSGAVLMVATSKPELFSRQILEHFDLMKYFDFLGGATMEEKRTAKADVIRHVLETCGLEDCLSRMRMVGDREYDILGARENNIQSVGVLYGYGDRRELEEAGADTLAETVEDLEKLLIRWLEEE